MLVSKVKDGGAGAFTRNFAMIFLELGVPRLDGPSKTRLGMEILHGNQ
jgi:hypothetical protein